MIRKSECPYYLLIVAIIVVYIIWTEEGSQNCLNKSCNNEPQTVEDEDSIRESIRKINATVRTNHRLVVWRRSLLVAIVSTFIIVFILYGYIPHGFDYTIGTLFIFMTVMFSKSWFQAHWWKMNDYKIQESLLDLENKVLS